jgi:hypothetical protein
MRDAALQGSVGGVFVRREPPRADGCDGESLRYVPIPSRFVPPRTETFRFTSEKPTWKKASLTVPSWNQIIGWLREMDLLRQAVAA